MKEKYCIVSYNGNTKKWNLILETAILKDFSEYNSRVKCTYYAKVKAKDNNTVLYIYDKKNCLIEKINYNLNSE